MRFYCDKNLLMKEILIAQEVVSNRSTISILSNVMMEVKEGKLIIRATDTKTAFESILPVNVESEGITTVNSEKFLGSLKNLPDGDVLFNMTDDSRFHIRPEKKSINYQLKTMKSENYPWVQWETEGLAFSIGQKEILEMINQTIFSVSDDDARYFMTGVLFEYKEGTFRLVATDGRRLSIAKIDMDISRDFTAIIPTKPLNLIRKLASGQGVLNIGIGEKSLVFSFDNQKIYSNFIDGQFPNYLRVIPESQAYTAKIKKEDLMDAIRRVSLMADQKAQRVFLTLADNNALIASDESELGLAREEIPVEYEGPQTVIALNYHYIQDPVRVCTENTIIMQFTDPRRAVTLKTDPEKNYFHIIMPMQMSE